MPLLSLWHRMDELCKEKVTVATTKRNSNQQKTGSWQNVFLALLEIPMAQGHRSFFNTIPPNSNEAIFEKYLHFLPKSTLKLSVSQHIGKLPTFSYTEDTLPIGVLYTHNGMSHSTSVTLSCSSSKLFSTSAWVLFQCLNCLSRGLEVQWLRALLWLSSGKKNNCSRCL